MCSKRRKIKSSKYKLDDYSKVKIPKDYRLIKMVSYNISLSNSVNIYEKIKETIEYIISNFNNKSIDIINLQEINDIQSLYLLIEEFKRYCFKENLTYYFSPSFDHINPNKTTSNSPTSSFHMIEKSFDSTGKITNDDKKRKIINNVIISKYPISSRIYKELDDKTDIDDILGIQILVGANILIGSSVISVYNINLSMDVVAAQLMNDDVRKTELINILEIIENNQQNNKSGINLITGTFNIPEIDTANNHEINKEYDYLISKGHFIDIFRLISEKDHGFTTTSKKRLNYVFLHMTNDFYKEGSDYFNMIIKNKNVDDLKKNLFKRYKIHFFDYYTLEQYDSLSSYFPIECIFMVSSI